MKFSPAWVKKNAFSDRERAGLKAINNGEIIEPLLCQRLKALGLVSQTRSGWVLTHQGQIRLLFDSAR